MVDHHNLEYFDVLFIPSTIEYISFGSKHVKLVRYLLIITNVKYLIEIK
jgi:hypothetical protein